MAQEHAAKRKVDPAAIRRAADLIAELIESDPKYQSNVDGYMRDGNTETPRQMDLGTKGVADQLAQDLADPNRFLVTLPRVKPL